MNSHLSDAQVRELLDAEIAKIKQDGIKFAVAGNAGYGKTSTVNALFNVNMYTSATDTATRTVHEVSMAVFPQEKEREISLTVYDLPGLADGEEQNRPSEHYFQIYSDLLPKMDVTLWVLRADVRAFKLDVDYLSQLVRTHPQLRQRIIIGLNFVDSIDPQDWSPRINQPSKKQLENLEEVKKRVSSVIHKECGLETNTTIPYSAKQAWQLDALFNGLTNAVPEGKKWVFNGLKANYSALFLSKVPEQFRETAAQMYVQKS